MTFECKQFVTNKLEIFRNLQQRKLYGATQQRPAFAPQQKQGSKKHRPGKFTGRRQQKQAAATTSLQPTQKGRTILTTRPAFDFKVCKNAICKSFKKIMRKKCKSYQQIYDGKIEFFTFITVYVQNFSVYNFFWTNFFVFLSADSNLVQNLSFYRLFATKENCAFICTFC
jgi:hypothetical protein